MSGTLKYPLPTGYWKKARVVINVTVCRWSETANYVLNVE